MKAAQLIRSVAKHDSVCARCNAVLVAPRSRVVSLLTLTDPELVTVRSARIVTLSRKVEPVPPAVTSRPGSAPPLVVPDTVTLESASVVPELVISSTASFSCHRVNVPVAPDLIPALFVPCRRMSLSSMSVPVASIVMTSLFRCLTVMDESAAIVIVPLLAISTCVAWMSVAPHRFVSARQSLLPTWSPVYMKTPS